MKDCLEVERNMMNLGVYRQELTDYPDLVTKLSFTE